MPQSFFSSEPFLGAIANACFPGRPWSIEPVEVEGKCFDVLFVSGRPADQHWVHPYYYVPSENAEPGSRRPVRFLKHVSHGVVAAPATEIERPYQPAPFIDWTPFSTWEEYKAFSHRGPHPAMWKTAAQGARRLARDAGPVTFTSGDPDPAALDAIIRWKSAQYRRTGALDRFLVPSARAVYDELLGRGLLIVSTLRAGGQVVAGYAGYRWDGCLYGRLISYDNEFGRYSPGAILVHRVLRESFEAGDREFDFLAGAEQYKWQYATHARVLGPIGRRSLLGRLEHRGRTKAGAWLLRKRQGRSS